MNTKSFNLEEIQNKFQSLLSEATKEDRFYHDSFILMAGYLSEIERIQKLKGINRKQLAKEISTSPSYLTQVFRGDKPLNFYTIAKIQNALQIRFQVTASLIGQNSISLPPQRAKKRSEPVALKINFLHSIKGGKFEKGQKKSPQKSRIIANA